MARGATAGIKSRKKAAAPAVDEVAPKAAPPKRAVGAGATKAIHLRIPAEMHTAIGLYADERGLTMREVCLAAIEHATTGAIDAAITEATADGRYRGSPGRPIKVRKN